MNVQRVVTALGFSIAGLVHATPARSDIMDCNGRIVSSGDSLAQVQQICSDPDAATHRIEVRTVRGPDHCCQRGGRTVCRPGDEYTVEVVVDDWTYDFGRNRFVRYLHFEQGRLLSIATGSYGQKPPR